jgi:hypothetical protein
VLLLFAAQITELIRLRDELRELQHRKAELHDLLASKTEASCYTQDLWRGRTAVLIREWCAVRRMGVRLRPTTRSFLQTPARPVACRSIPCPVGCLPLARTSALSHARLLGWPTLTPHPSYVQIERSLEGARQIIERIALSMWKGGHAPEQFASECSLAQMDVWLQILDARVTQVR